MDPYLKARAFARSANTELNFTTATTTTTLASAKSSAYTLWVQRLIVTIKTSAAQSITFEDNNGTAKYVCKIPATPGADTTWAWDFGPKGVPLTLGKNLVATFSAAGLAGHLEVQAYQTDRDIS